MLDTKTTLVHFTDIHLRDTNPPSRLGDYRGDILDKIRRVGQIGRDAGASAFTCGGDWFHEKIPMKTSHSMVYELMTIIKGFGAPCYTIIGNHDVRFDKTSTYPEQPLGPLVNSGIVKLQNRCLVRADDAAPSVMLHGFDFAEDPDYSSISLADSLMGEADYHVLSLHVYASRSGGTLHGKAKVHSYGDLLGLGYDVILLGHYHADQGVVRMTRPDGTSCLFVNIGSLSRGDYGDENLHRIPKCCVLRFGRSGIDAEEVPVGAKAPSEVFDLQEKAEKKAQVEEAEAFVEKLRSVEVATGGEASKDPRVLLQSMPIDDDLVLRKTKEFLDAADELLKKSKGIL